MTIDTPKAVGSRPPALLVICFALLMAGAVRAGQGADASLSPMRALQQAHLVAEGSVHPRHVVTVQVTPGVSGKAAPGRIVRRSRAALVNLAIARFGLRREKAQRAQDGN